MSAFCCMTCLLIVPAILTYFSYVFGWQNPDQNRGGADNLSCYLVKDESRQKWNFYAGDQDKDVMEQSGVKYENHSDLFITWCKMCFFGYAIYIGINVIILLSVCINVEFGVKVSDVCTKLTSCAFTVYGIILLILGGIWRWGDAGTICACYGGSCGVAGDPNTIPNGYFYETGKFMNIYLVISASLNGCVFGLCLLAILTCCGSCCCAVGCLADLA